MKHRRLRAAVFLAAAAMAVPAAAQQASDEGEFRAFVEGLRNGTLPAALAVRDCERDFKSEDTAGEFREMLAGYLEVPEGLALGAFCEALVRAVRAGDVTVATGNIIAQEKMDADFFFEFGRLLRAVHFAHRLTTTASAAQEPQP